MKLISAHSCCFELQVVLLGVNANGPGLEQSGRNPAGP